MCPRARVIIPGLLRKVEKLEDDLKKFEAADEIKRKKKRPIWLFVIVLFIVWSFVLMNKEVETMSKGQYQLP